MYQVAKGGVSGPLVISRRLELVFSILYNASEQSLVYVDC